MNKNLTKKSSRPLAAQIVSKGQFYIKVQHFVKVYRTPANGR